MKHKILVTSIFLMGLTSCMKVSKKGEENKSAPATNPAAEYSDQRHADNRSELTYVYDIEGKAGLKKVRFTAAVSWPESVVVKKIDGEKSAEFGVEFDEDSEWSDLLISENKVSYQFFSKLDDQLILLEEVEVLPPLNMDVLEDVNLAQKYALNHKTKLIYFEKLSLGLQKHIYLDNFSGKIQIQNLESKSGFIQSYPANARAAAGFDGKDGGILDIEILNGSGDVTVFMKGENGGTGLPAPPADAALNGAPGARGAAALFTMTASVGFLAPGSFVCTTKPGDGANGARGLTGYPGNDGKSGGHTGKANVKSLASQLAITIDSQVGSFGSGSVGGAGGIGGDAGVAADGGDEDLKLELKSRNVCMDNGVDKCYIGMLTLIKCAPAKAGETGPVGERGPPGNNGVDGTKQKSCLYQGEQKIKCINE